MPSLTNMDLKAAYTKVINKHYSAVQTDTALEHTDNWKLEKKSKQFWEDFYQANNEFINMLNRCTINDQ
jgi:hypothetical protein